MRNIESLIGLFFLIPFLAFSQPVTIEGYVFETGNRGYLNMATITVVDEDTKALRGETQTDLNGKFELAVDPGKSYLVRVRKKPFENLEQVLSTKEKKGGEKLFAKFEMKRMPGYLFEVTLAPSRSGDDVVVDAITGAWIEVYNNTIEKEITSLRNHPSHTFSCRFEQGNHYTILIRKEGFFNKRLEAYVNVKGCILCFDGVGEVKPGVSDVLTEGLEMGTLLANVELQKIEMNKSIDINNIYYDSNSARIKSAGRQELDQLAVMLNDNSNLLVEIGSHTDSQGDDKFNQKLSLKRARGVVKYLVDKGIKKERLLAKGYGESKLRNSCGNGVKCSERRHQKNRRTELKVLGYAHENVSSDVSLADMKAEEALVKMLEELGNSEIKIEAGQELPEELKKQFANKEKESLAKQSTPTKREKETVVEQTKRESVVLVEQKETAPVVKEKPEREQSNPVQKQESEIISEETRPTPNDIMRDEEESFGETYADLEFRAQDNQVKVTPDREVTTLSRLPTPSRLASNYNGHKVQIITAISELPMSHELFSRHGNIIIEETKRGTFAYLLGDFKSKDDAYDFMENVLSVRYPNAKVVTYKNGRRVVN